MTTLEPLAREIVRVCEVCSQPSSVFVQDYRQRQPSRDEDFVFWVEDGEKHQFCLEHRRQPIYRRMWGVGAERK